MRSIVYIKDGKHPSNNRLDPVEKSFYISLNIFGCSIRETIKKGELNPCRTRLMKNSKNWRHRVSAM